MTTKHLVIAFFSCLLFSFFTSCSGVATKPPGFVEDAVAVDSTKNKPKKDTVKVVKVVIPSVHEVYNDVAKYIAGMKITPPSKIDSTLLNSAQWKEYSESFEKNWQKIDSTRIKTMKDWRSTELKEVNSKTIFYPFSGADFLNVYTFFPSAENYIMVGLEPEGTLPHFHKGMPKDSLSSYFYKIRTSLYTILNFSFFRTKSMSVDFRNGDLNGTIHIILLFLERTGNSIIDIKPVAVGDDGKMITYDSFEARKKDNKENKGIEIDFMNTDNHPKKIYYFSVNLDNSHLTKNTAFSNLVIQNKEVTTYLKSASYLMYKDYFSSVRDLILSNSKFVLEDDSGIPYKYFKDAEWAPTFYGKYNGAISLFQNVFQKDLDSAYKEPKNSVKPLAFGIGYKYKVGESNLMLFKKK
jgi:hypothetical protein